MNEHSRAVSLALHEVKRNIHEYAVYSRARGVESYVPLKTVDAIIDLCIKKYSTSDVVVSVGKAEAGNA